MLVGVFVFCLWVFFAGRVTTPAGASAAFNRLPPSLRDAWIVCRVAAAIGTVPIAEELAYRGFLTRRILAEDFGSVALRRGSVDGDRT